MKWRQAGSKVLIQFGALGGVWTRLPLILLHLVVHKFLQSSLTVRQYAAATRQRT